MRRSILTMAGLGIALTSAAAVASADEARPASQLLVLGQRAGAPAAPTILRGSVAAPTATAAAISAGSPTQVVAGQQLWLIDNATGEVQSCINLQTTTVGVRDIQCTIAELGDYSRTFGPNFRP